MPINLVMEGYLIVDCRQENRNRGRQNTAWGICRQALPASMVYTTYFDTFPACVLPHLGFSRLVFKWKRDEMETVSPANLCRECNFWLCQGEYRIKSPVFVSLMWVEGLRCAWTCVQYCSLNLDSPWNHVSSATGHHLVSRARREENGGLTQERAKSRPLDASGTKKRRKNFSFPVYCKLVS